MRAAVSPAYKRIGHLAPLPQRLCAWDDFANPQLVLAQSSIALIPVFKKRASTVSTVLALGRRRQLLNHHGNGIPITGGVTGGLFVMMYIRLGLSTSDVSSA